MDEKPPERRPLQFGLRTLLEIVAVAAFVLTLLYYRTDKGSIGRYQGFARDQYIYLLDTESGEMWRSWTESDKWSPVKKLPIK